MKTGLLGSRITLMLSYYGSTVILDMKSQTIKFIIDNENNNVIYYRNIPRDKPLSRIVFLYSQNDTVEIVKY